MAPAVAQTAETEQDMFAALASGDKCALVAVHYGCNGNDGQQKRIERLNRQLAQTYPTITFREAWTDVAGLSGGNGRKGLTGTLNYVLDDLWQQGYTHVLVQPSFMTAGTEMDYVRHEAAAHSGKFRQLRVGQQLLGGREDYVRAAHMTMQHGVSGKGTANIVVCGGEDLPSMALLDYILKEENGESWMVVTTTDFPRAETLVRLLKLRKIKKAKLIHFSFMPLQHDDVERVHETLKAAGVKILGEEVGLGESDDFVRMFTDHALHAQHYRSYSPVELKMIQATGRDQQK